MKKIKIFGIFMSIMIIASCFVSTISVNAKNDLAEEYFKIQKSDKNELATYLENQDQNYDFTGRIKDDGTTKTVQLTDEELQRLYAMIDSVEDAEVQIRLQNVLDNSLDGKGEIELNALGEIAIITYDYVSNLPPQICPDDESMVINTSIPSENMISSGTSTYFYPEFWDNFDYYDGWGAYGSYSGSNKYTGAVAVISDAWVGYGRAEARQRIQFYIGSTKTITITGETLSAGGNANLPPAAVAGSDITLIFNNDAEQFWFNPIDEAFGYEWFEGIILWFFQALFPGSGVTRIDIIIDLLMTINSIIDWAIAMNQLINAQSHTITHSFTLEPGWYTAGVGIRSISSGCVVGHAMNGRFGDVEYIKVDGIASPDTPNVHGDAIGYVGIPYEISFSSEDPNEDDVQYKIDWGDGDISDWSDFFVHNTEITGEHTYLDPGYYTIRVKARDRDLMESDDWGSYEVHIIYPDTEAPETWIDSGPSGLIDYNDNIEFTWSGWDAVTPPEDLQYSYKLVEGQSGGTWSSWTSSTSKTYNGD